MKKIALLLSLCVVAGCVMPGCSKSKDAGSKSGNESSGAASASGPVELKLKWTVGKKYVQRMEMTQSSKMTLPGAAKPTQQVMEMASEYSISALKELPDGGRDLELEFLSTKMEAKMGDRVMMSFDSAQDTANDKGNPLAPTLRNMVGVRIHYLTDANGKVQSVTGFKEFMERMGGGQAQAAMLNGMFNEDTLKHYADLSHGLPDHPVKVGDSWPFKIEMPMGAIGNLTMNLNYTYKGMEPHDDRNCARLEYTGDISSKPGTNASPMAIQIEKGKIAGTMWFDPDLGMVVGTTGDQDMDMKITAQGKPITTTLSQKVNLKLVEVADLEK